VLEELRILVILSFCKNRAADEGTVVELIAHQQGKAM
jgi:hypothetical protein